MEMNLEFKELRKYISSIDRISICMEETKRYENYRYIRDIPDKYDQLYVYGIGMIESEFEINDPFDLAGVKEEDIGKDFYFAKCIEILLSEKPRNTFFSRGTVNSFAQI